MFDDGLTLQVVEKRDEELKDRETYIRQLEETLRQQSSHMTPSQQPSALCLRTTGSSVNLRDKSPIPEIIPLPASPAVQEIEVQPEATTPQVSGLSPSLAERFNDLQSSLAVFEGDSLPDAKAQVRIDTLLRYINIAQI